MEYSIVRSARRTLAVEIDREGKVTVRAPKRCPRSTIDSFLDRKSDWIAQHIQMQLERSAAHPEPNEERRRQLIEKARSVLPARVEFFSGIMGLSPTGLKITSARTRFGSCSAQNSICFSWRLMEFPDEAIDYVVVHELAHIVHKNHGAQFYALIESVLPDWRQRRALLRE